MKKIFSIWILGAVINLFLMTYMLISGIFAGNTSSAIIWICVNFIPISIALGYASTIGQPFKNKVLSQLLVVFLILCLVSLYSRNFLPNLAYFHSAIRIAPIILIPLQIFILFLVYKETKAVSHLSDNNIQLLINKITSLEEAEIISSDPEEKFSLNEKLKKLRVQLAELKAQKEAMSNEQ